MGLFTRVKVVRRLIPKEYRQYIRPEGWQTKDVVEPSMDTLEITAKGELFYEFHKYDVVEDPGSFVGFYMKPIKTYRVRLDFHGDMRFYTSHENDEGGWDFIDLVARFTEGKLQKIFPYKPLFIDPRWQQNEEEET